MKMNKWTMALAAAGVVSLSSVAQAQEAVAGANALAASTTLSGYVSTSYSVNDDTTTATDDKFRLDVVDLKLASAIGAGEYASGYTVELWLGDDAGDLGTGNGSADGTVELLQANIDLRLPWGNGVDLKIGQFQTNVGAEVSNRNENPFYTRSIGFETEPTHHTGVLGSYQATDDIGLSFGVVNDDTTAVTNAEAGSGATYLAGVTYTLSDSAGALGGTEISYQRVDGSGADNAEQDNQYLGVSLPAGWPIEGVSYSLAWDVAEYDAFAADSNVLGHYLSYAVNDKATLNVRWETGNTNGSAAGVTERDGIDSWTVGLDYQIWENVISRVEYQSSDYDGQASSAESLVFNIIYSF